MNYVEGCKELESIIEYHFQDPKLLLQALTHSSYANEMRINRLENYERLEFLGDAVLEVVSSDFLFRKHPDLPEGKLSKLRSSMVCEPALAYCARAISLPKYILLGKGEDLTGGRDRDSIVSDVLEAVIGAIYLDGGIEPADRFIHRFILSDADEKRLFYDAKSILQERIQRNGKGDVTYTLLEESGPDHEKIFRVNVSADHCVLGYGEGHSKKAAEQAAAFQALKQMDQ